MTREWPLVAFTVGAQLAVGSFFFIGGALYLFVNPLGEEVGRGEFRLAVILGILGLLVAATVFSFFHLHHPFRAFRVLSNVRMSWLSREILFELMLVAALLVLAFCEWQGVGRAGFVRGVVWFGVAAGTLFLYSMTRIYRLGAVPFWNHIHTVLSFFLTAFGLGAAAAALVLGRSMSYYYRYFIALAFVFQVASFMTAALLAPKYGLSGVPERPSLRPPRGSHGGILHVVRLGFLVLGALLFGSVLVGEGRWLGTEGNLSMILAAGFLMALGGEVSGRILFYYLGGSQGR